MSTPRCPACGTRYWRYRGDYPPRGYCSVKCWWERRRKQTKPPAPEKPEAVIESFREHRIEVHQTRDLTAWFDCETCERFEERYAVSMYL